MLRKKMCLGILAGVALLSLPQVAGATSPAPPAADDVAYRAIMARDWSAAEQQLLAGLAKDPTNVFRQLNLAWVYAQTGRKEQAAMIYQRILMSDQDQVAAVRSGDIAVVVIGEEATVKRYFPRKEKLLLFPENDDYEPIEVKPSDPDVRVAGKVVGVFRRLDS